MSETVTFTARWIFPVDAPPLEQGTVTVAGERIVAVEPRGCRHADIDFGNAAVLPGFVNAHTHLDLGGLRGKVPPGPDFTAWLRAVIAHRRGVTPEQTGSAIRAGLQESIQCGTTLVGDISAGGASWQALSESPIRAVVFYEMLGLTKERAALTCRDVTTWLIDHQDTTTCRRGLSPHAPYSVRLPLFFTAFFATVPTAVHLAETGEELTLLADRRGPFVAFLRELGVWAPDGLAEGPEDVLRLCSGLAPALFVHANYLKPDAPIPPKGSIVYCPRTHAAFGHPPHPFRDFLTRGVRVALGTDSLASNPDLDLLAEARFLHASRPDVPGDVLLRLATLSGAEALGWADQTGSLTPGKSADLVVLPLPEKDSADPYQLILASDTQVERVMCRGRWIFEVSNT